MQRDLIVEKYTELNKDAFLTNAEAFVDNNVFEGLGSLSVWIANILVNKITSKAALPSFSKHLGCFPTIYSLLAKGDKYYTDLFRDNGYITPQTKNKECLTILTTIFEEIYQIIIDQSIQFNESLVIYSYLRKCVNRKVQTESALNKTFMKFEYWSAIEQIFTYSSNSNGRWIYSIPINTIEAELSEIKNLENRDSLHDLAISFENGISDKNYERYLQRFKEIPTEPVFAYLSKAIGSDNSWHFKRELGFRFRLLHRLGVKYWVELMDKLKYPFLQDHAFSYITNTNDYGDIIEILTDANNIFITPHQHLIAITLNNFLNFAQQTSLELMSYQSENRYFKAGNKDEIKLAAKADFFQWFDFTLPNTFNRIIGKLFPESDISQLLYLELFFEWINKYPLENENVLMDAELRRVMKLLRPIFQERLNSTPAICLALLEKIPLEKYNWCYFEMFGDCLEAHVSLGLQDILLVKYEEYIASRFFKWNVQSCYTQEVINQTYRFSELLAHYNDCEHRWQALNDKFKVFHEGWLCDNEDRNIRMSRECYLLMAGIGLTYRLYEKNERLKAAALLTHLNVLVISQYRIREKAGNDYVIPMKFIVFVKAKYCIAEMDKLLMIFVSKIYELKDLLTLLAEAKIQLGARPNMTYNLKSELLRRINVEFPFLMNDLRHPHQKNDLECYTRIKDELLASIV